jgi:hypothetical protein
VVRVFLGRVNGRRRYLNKAVHGSKKDAENVLTSLLRDRDLGTLVEPTRMTLHEYLDEWLKTAAKPRVRLRMYQGRPALEVVLRNTRSGARRAHPARSRGAGHTLERGARPR